MENEESNSGDVEQKLKSGTEKYKIHIHNKPINDYTENPELLSKCFPRLFTFGLLETGIGGTGPLSRIVRKTLLLFYDHRFATNSSFLFMNFDQDMRRQTNQGVSIRVNRGDPRTDQVMEQINEEGFLEELKIASKNPKSEEAKRIRKTILPLLKLFGAKIRWSPIERKSTLSRIYALYHAFGLPFIFGTISPGMRDSLLTLRMCHSISSSFDNNIGQVELPKIDINIINERDRFISSNPVAAAGVFDAIINPFFPKIMVIPFELLRKRKSSFERHLQVNREQYIGAYGYIRASYGAIEAQGSGGLHVHFHM